MPRSAGGIVEKGEGESPGKEIEREKQAAHAYNFSPQIYRPGKQP